MPKVIEWSNPGADEIIWRYPSESIEWGSQLIVHEYEVAVFMRDGKLYDVFGPGRHTITTLNLPLLGKALKTIAGYDKNPFRATVIFVSLKEFRGTFGGETQTKELAPLKFYGSYWFKVLDPKLFLTEVVGGQGLYESSDVSKFLRGYFNENMMKYLNTYSIVDVFQHLDRVTMEVKVKLLEDFRRLGLEIIDVKFEGVNTTEDWRQRLFWLMQTGRAEYVLQMDTAKQVAKELGKSPGAAVGAGVAIIPPLFYPPPPGQQAQPAPQTPPPSAQPPVPAASTTTPAGYVPRCPYCGKPVPQGARFCPYCGKPLKWCPNGHVAPAEAKFCPVCGAKLE